MLEHMLPKGPKARATLQDLESSGFKNSEKFRMLGCMIQRGRRPDPHGRNMGLRNSGNDSNMDRKDKGSKAR
jgi:hypothetical protein